MKLSLLVILVAGVTQQVLSAPSVDQELIGRLKEGPANVLVRMKERTTQTLATVESMTFSSRTERIETMVSLLKAFTSESQKPVVDYLTETQGEKNFEFESLWVTNMIMVRDVDLETALRLAEFPEVEYVRQEEQYPLDPILNFHEYTPEELDNLDENEIQWGVAHVQAPTVWESGNRGQQILIATVDTGVRVTHEALANNFVGEYGWYDPGQQTSEPNDGNGHGTHTTGTIAGAYRNIGVAPGSLWAACKGCASSFCLQFDLLKCGQWVACPTLTNDTEPDCSRAPNLVSNSWGGGSGNEWYKETVDAQRTAGIVPLFSQGNSGPSCGSARSPGDYDNLIGVGSTTELNELSYFSSVGPTTIGGRIKPDVAAPGSDVFSAYHTGDNAYASMSGTSMACPHAAGTVALIMAENPNLSYGQVKDMLTMGSVGVIADTGANCGGIPETQYPNNHVGAGRIDALNSVNNTRKIFGGRFH